MIVITLCGERGSCFLLSIKFWTHHRLFCNLKLLPVIMRCRYFCLTEPLRAGLVSLRLAGELLNYHILCINKLARAPRQKLVRICKREKKRFFSDHLVLKLK